MKPAPKPRKKRAYHHGDLAGQLVAAAEAIILERGVDGFTLREAARRAGVSPAAPAHHFGDARGLLSEVALRGFRDFGDALEAADKRGGDDPQKRLHEQGAAYVKFALANPARFQLMFQHGKCDMGYKDLAAVGHRSFLILEGAVRAAYGLSASDTLTDDAHGFLLATWSVVHGFAHLALGGDLDGGSGRTGDVLTSFLPRMLKHLPPPNLQR
ncbi:MAG TPA: TetR/AcrR family transcriptional regulator [Rhizomicrobium sp.]|jgi:AcrR family transcriptional regulator|nr:TetR/AcrR family transcriptional regulator [Rhizomicrobium sp.]